MDNPEMIYEICAKDSIAQHAAGLLQNCATLLTNNSLVDCTIVCKDGQLQAHKVILAASSNYLQELLTTTSLPTPCSHPLIFLRRWKTEDLKTVLEYIYTGQTTVRQTKLATILKLCDELEYLTLAKAVMKATSKSKSRSSSRSSSATGATILPISLPNSTTPNLVNSSGSGESRTTKSQSNKTPLKFSQTFSSHAEKDPQNPTPPPPMESGRVTDSNGYNDHTEALYSNPVFATSPLDFFMKSESFVKSEMESGDDCEEDFYNNDTEPIIVSAKRMANGNHKRQREMNAIDVESAKRPTLANGNGTYHQNGLLSLDDNNVKLELDQDDNESGEEGNDDEDGININLVKPEDLLEVGQQDAEGESSSQCPWCHETFTGVAAFQRHLRTHVNKYRPYSCEYCHTSFARSAHLKRHLRTHTGEKPYICTVCQRAFARQDKLKGHMERHLQEANRNENFLSNNNNSHSNDGMTITSFSQGLTTPTTTTNQVPVKVLISSGEVGRPNKIPSTNQNSFKSHSSSSSSLLLGNGPTNGNRFEIGSTTSNGLSISLASSNKESREKSKFLGGGGLTVTPASRPSPAYIQSLTSRGVGTMFTNGDVLKSKPSLNYIVNNNYNI